MCGNSSLKLCFINPTRQQRAVVYELAKQLTRYKKYEITILQPSKRGKLRAEACPPQTNNIDIVYFPVFFFSSFSYNVPFINKEIKVLNRLLLEKKCEIIQACDYDYLSSIAPILVKRKHKIPIVLTNDAFPGYSWFYGNSFIDASAKLYTYGIGKRILNSYDKVILLYTKALKEIEKFGVPTERVCAIPNGIDSEYFKLDLDASFLRAKFSIEPDEKVLLFVGRLATVKRIEVLIKLTKSLIKEGFKIKTVIVGDGPQRKYYEELSRLIKKHVVFVGYVPKSQVYRYYFLADIFILPSLSEGLPSVLLEASAAGKPCVATDVNGVSDIVVHEKTGYLVQKSDVDGFKRYVRMLLENESVLRRFGGNAAKFVKENFNWSVVVGKYEKIYREILSQ